MPHTVDQKKAAAFARPEASEVVGKLSVCFGLSGLQNNIHAYSSFVPKLHDE